MIKYKGRTNKFDATFIMGLYGQPLMVKVTS